ncbi:hypothetical protein [Nocardioides sambongensis]|uniref:hypothetical protein n=1 Tax=Nocardioides sambongensis TaxID=2589074 RepID=UPI00112BD2C5|nr:hypothetical protein [Nocardioides sambongensis]
MLRVAGAGLRGALAVPAALALALALVLAAGLGACSTGTSDPDRAEPGPTTDHVVITPPPAEPGIALSVVQQRLDEGTDRADLRIINITAGDLRVRRIGVRWPGFPGPTLPRAEVVGAGATLDLPMRLPAPDCTVDVEDAETAPPATGIAVTATADGQRTVRRPIDEAGMRFLTRLWSEACARERVASLVRLSWIVPDRTDGPVLTMRLALDRSGGRTGPQVALTEVAGSVLFDLSLPGRGPSALRPDRARARLPVRVDPGRCDEHARSQASQPVTFRVWLRIGRDTENTSAVVLPDAGGRARLLRFLDRACGDTTAH